MALATVRSGIVDEADYLALMEKFSEFFRDPKAICDRFNAWSSSRHQQPGPKGAGNSYEPAWVDFLVADLTCNGELPVMEVPAWRNAGSCNQD